ncbi:helix-turn-helix transcriptional regulator [Roseinatronobacter alkalisoli]|uniref:YafY family protein n=1 Tax=Roseinatronobacter alkalisoli TaxID=3028235 RepID=A0ABT5T4E0_9RHOB|nr:YafY family protein [Roseinatronobacter sp. HJB301]MDD7969983.1 YafY family protein [Roseinatronobacter sp. HJB301]
MKTHRLFSLLDHLRSARRPVPAGVLAQRLGVSTRTIYRDVATLQEIGAPIRGEAGIGYQLEQGYFLPPLQFDTEEMEAIMLGMRHLMARRGGGLRDAAERVTGKVAASLGAEVGQKFQNLNLLAVTRHRAADVLAEQWGGMARRAIRARRVLQITYVSLEGRRSERRVQPLGITLFDDVWLLTAWCERADDFRNFRLDRVETMLETEEVFRPASGRQFKDYVLRL